MARPLPDYYKTKCEFSGEDAPWKFLIYEFKMAGNQHYLPRLAQYQVNRAR